MRVTAVVPVRFNEMLPPEPLLPEGRALKDNPVVGVAPLTCNAAALIERFPPAPDIAGTEKIGLGMLKSPAAVYVWLPIVVLVSKPALNVMFFVELTLSEAKGAPVRRLPAPLFRLKEPLGLNILITFPLNKELRPCVNDGVLRKDSPLTCKLLALIWAILPVVARLKLPNTNDVPRLTALVD